MPDCRLELELERWLTEQRVRERLSPPQIEELSDHLLQSAGSLLSPSRDEREALRIAAADLGDVSRLALEFQKENPRMSPLSKLTGIGITTAVLLFAMGFALPLSTYLHIPAMIVVLGLVLGALWASFGPGAVWGAVRISLTGRGAPTAEERELFDSVLQRGYALSWAAGFIGVMLGAIAILSNLGSDDPRTLGQAVALCIFAILYGGLLAELGFRTLRQWLRATSLSGLDAR